MSRKYAVTSFSANYSCKQPYLLHNYCTNSPINHAINRVIAYINRVNDVRNEVTSGRMTQNDGRNEVYSRRNPVNDGRNMVFRSGGDWVAIGLVSGGDGIIYWKYSR